MKVLLKRNANDRDMFDLLHYTATGRCYVVCCAHCDYWSDLIDENVNSRDEWEIEIKVKENNSGNGV